MSTPSNKTFWPSSIVERASGGIGWTPLPRALTANWFRFQRDFEVGPQHFLTLVSLLTWVRDDFENVRFTQVAIANQQGDHRTTVWRHIQKMHDAGIVTLIEHATSKRLRISFAPLMTLLEKYEAERKAQKEVRAVEESMKSVGILRDEGGRPPAHRYPSQARWGRVLYDEPEQEPPEHDDALDLDVEVGRVVTAAHDHAQPQQQPPTDAR